MGLPPQETFTLEEVAQRSGRSVDYLEQLVCDRVFKYIIVKGKFIDGSAWKHHVYFDIDLLRQHRPPERRAVLTEKEKKDEKEWRKKRVKQIRSLLAEQQDDTPGKVYEKEAERQIDNIQRGITEERTHWIIGPNESAFLSQPSHPSEKWNRPEGWIIYIPRIALEDFEEKYGPFETANPTKKKHEKSPAPDNANHNITLERWPWRNIAREIGQSLAREQRNRTLTLEQLAEKVHEEMKKRHNYDGAPELLNRSGRIPEPASIRRHALQNIGS